MLSVIVPVYQAQAYLAECLDSVRAQTYDVLQIVVVDDGSTDGSAALIAEHAAADPRILVHRQQNAGLGAARNAGIARATGDYLTFLDADDTLPRRAYELLVGSLERTGSDFALGAVQRVTAGVRRTPAWIAEAHEKDRSAIRIDDFPRAVIDVIACNRVFRRSFWETAGLRFPVGVAYEDHVPMMAAYLRAQAFDVLADTTYYWRIREDQTSIGQQKHQIANLRDRLQAKRDAWSLLLQEATPAVRAAWQVRVLDMDLPLFYEQLPGADEAYFAELRRGVAEQLAAAGEAVLAEVRAERRVKALLAAAGRRSELEALLSRELTDGPIGRTRIEGTAVVADFAGIEGLTTADRTLPQRQTRLRTTLRRCWWAAPGELRLDLAAYVPYLDHDRFAVSAAWVGRDGQRVPVTIRTYADPEITRDAQPTCHDYDGCAVRVELPVAELLTAAPPGSGELGEWHLELRVQVGPVVRTDVVRFRVGEGSAGVLHGSVADAGVRLELDHERERGLVLRATRSAGVLVGAQVQRGRLCIDAVGATAPLTRVVALGRERVPAPVEPHRGVLRGRFELDRLRAATPDGRWPLRAVAGEDRTLLAWSPRHDADDLLPVEGSTTGLLLQRTRSGTVLLTEGNRIVEVRSTDLAPARLHLQVRVCGEESLRPHLVLEPDLRQQGETVPLEPDRGGRTWELPGGPATLASQGRWGLAAYAPDGTPLELRIAPALLGELPVLVRAGGVRTRVVRGRGQVLALDREPEQPVGVHGRPDPSR